VEWVPGDTMPVDGLSGVWGSGPGDVFAVGDGHFLLSVWGLSSTDVYAAYTGGVLHYDGTEWNPVPGLPECPHFSVWGSAPDDLFASNICGIAHYDGATWTHMDPGITGGVATELIGFGPHDVVANTEAYIYRGTR
jgi:hypothetical protein